MALFLMYDSVILVDHILLKDEADDETGWTSFSDAFWKVLLYSIGGDLDDTAFPNMVPGIIFLGFILTVVIIMLNILIAIVSDSCEWLFSNHLVN